MEAIDYLKSEDCPNIKKAMGLSELQLYVIAGIMQAYHKKQCAINGVVFNEAEDCRKCLKPKRMKPNTIQMLCECVDSEVELFCRVCKSDNIKHHPEEYYECLGCGHEFTK